MNLHTLKPNKGSTKNRKRIGRGQGSGRGRTATKGHKGDKARSGYARKVGFEGGQMPLQRRVPKFGFKNPNRVEYKVINLDDIQSLLSQYPTKVVDTTYLKQHGVIASKDLVKVLGRGQLNVSSVEFKLHAFSASALEAINKSGSTATVIS